MPDKLGETLYDLMEILSKLFTNLVYVQVYESKMVARSVESGKEVSLLAVKPFSHKRSIIGNYSNAEELLTECVKQISNGKLLFSSPKMIIHPMERVDGGLTQVEARALKELGAGAGAREVLVYLGEALTDKELKSNLDAVKFV